MILCFLIAFESQRILIRKAPREPALTAFELQLSLRPSSLTDEYSSLQALPISLFTHIQDDNRHGRNEQHIH